MLRAISSVIVGYVAMFAFVFITFSIAMFALGVDATYKPYVWDVSNTWLIISFVLGLLAAMLGGWICALIARSPTPPVYLAALVLIFGLLMALPAFFVQDQAAPPTPRPVNVSVLEAMQHSKTPTVALLLNPVIGAIGVLIGARMRPSDRSPAV